MGIKSRRKARQLALEVAYRLDLLSEEVNHIYQDVLSREECDSVCKEFLTIIIKSLEQHIDKIDELIKDSLVNWDFDRLSYIERAIMRIAVAELLSAADVPYKVTLSEAVELAKIYSTPSAAAFINGILDNIVEKLGIKKE